MMDLCDFPRPWRLTYDDRDQPDGVVDANGQDVPEHKVAANFMLLCVNSHADLLAACRHAVETTIAYEHDTIDDLRSWCRAIQVMCGAAIAKAGST